jgi:energy-converting hydrogenase A subunit M
MSFDPCGTRTLDGEEILRRLAKYLEVNVEDLKAVLTNKQTS